MDQLNTTHINTPAKPKRKEVLTPPLSAKFKSHTELYANTSVKGHLEGRKTGHGGYYMLEDKCSHLPEGLN